MLNNLIITIAVCGVIRAILDIILPETGMKNITNLSTNLIIFSAIFNAVIIIIKNVLLK